MVTLSLNMFLMTALAVVVLYVGSILKKRIHFLQTFCIPELHPHKKRQINTN